MGLFDRFRSRQIVLLYHRVANVSLDPWSLCVTPEHFCEHLEVLRKYHRVRLNEVGQAGSNIGCRQLSVAITFDDGYADNLYEAAPVLKRYDMPATFFLSTGYIGSTREFWWDELEKAAPMDAYFPAYGRLQLLWHEERRQILAQMLAESGHALDARLSHRSLTEQEVVHLAADELFEIGAHTVTHPVLSSLPLDAQFGELRDSRKHLEDLVGRPVTSCSYPYGGTGHYSADTARLVEGAGYSRGCTTTARPVNYGKPYEIPRFNITNMGGAEFERLLLTGD